jgi:hypothetical protein
MAILTTTTINDTGFLTLPSGTNAQKPSPVVGGTRYNTNLSTVEYYDGTQWRNRIVDNSNIITNGLVLNLDARESRSYPGSGTIWTDLSGQGNNGTLVNGVGYNSSDGGSLVFDGVNDSVNIPVSSSLQSQTFTFDIWFKLNTVPAGGSPLLMSHYQGSGTVSGLTVFAYQGQYWFQTRFNNSCCQNLVVGTASTNTWVNFCGTYDGSIKRAYLNGVQVGTQSVSGTHSQLNNFSIGNNADNIAVGDYTSSAANGFISSVKYYNRALAAPEILQNYLISSKLYGTGTAYGFLSGTTFTVPRTGNYVIYIIGGGGAAGASWYGNFYGSGGGSGFYNELRTFLTQNEVLTINIGAGGPGAAWNGAGGAGGTTSVVRSGVTLVSAGGGNPGGNAVGGSGGSGGGPGPANSDFRPGQGGYNGSNGQNSAGTGGSGQLGVAYGSGYNLFIPPGGSGSYAGGANPWAGIYGFGAAAQAGGNTAGQAAGGGGGGGSWATAAQPGRSGLVVVYGPII